MVSYTWLDAKDGLAGLEGSPTEGVATLEDTLQHSREQLVSRWSALRGGFGPGAPQTWYAGTPTQEQASVCALYSLSGGVGKTSLAAALGRALASAGEAVLLAEVSAHGLLPFHFGAQSSQSPSEPLLPAARKPVEEPVLRSYSNSVPERADMQALFEAELDLRRQRGERVVVDICSAAPWAVRLLVQRRALLLLPIAADMTSVLRLQAAEQQLRDLSEELRQPVHVRYLLNQFEANLPLHLDVREVLRSSLGERLLPFAIRRSAEVAEALAEAMTVMDYAPASGIAADYRVLAAWLRALPPGKIPAGHKVDWTGA